MLESGRLGDVGGRQRMGMNAGEGQVAEHEPQLATELPLQPLDGPEGQAAVGALIIAILDQCDRGVCAAVIRYGMATAMANGLAVSHAAAENNGAFFA